MRRLKNLFHHLEAVVANIYYGFPSRKLKVIGVTGTDGKTTTTHLIYHILKSSGKKASMISTVYAKVGDREYDTGLHTTTPSSFLIQKLLKIAFDKGDEYFVLETTSHALDQSRVYGINFLTSVVTNITHEHLDYHQNYDNYLLTKARLLLKSDISILNRDDSSFEKLKNLLIIHKKKFQTYSLKNRSDYRIDFNKLAVSQVDFNKYNYTASYAVAKSIGIADQAIFSAMKTFKLPIGRLDVVYNKDFQVVIDFAHTPNAIKNILEALKGTYLKNNGRIIHVFGSAGLRDKTKRPLMGEESAKYADLVILTEEDHRIEDPYKICEQIGEGLKMQDFRFFLPKLFDQKDNKIYTIITNRAEAIKKAILTARKNDIVIITGKGHEKSLCRGKKEYPWNEKSVVMTVLKKNYDNL